MTAASEIAFFGGPIVNSMTPRVLEGLTVKAGKINQIFSNRSALENYAKRNGCEMINLAGKAIIPGQVDPHTLASFMCQFVHLVSLERVTDSVTTLTRIRQAAAKAQALNEPYVRLVGWNNGTLPLTSQKLDEILPSLPVIIYNASFHGAVFNTAAVSKLQADGFAMTTLSTDGHLTGSEFETILDKMRPEPVNFARSLMAYQDRMLSLGITTAHDLLVQYADQMRVFEALGNGGQLKLNWRLVTTNPDLLGFIPTLKNAGVDLLGVKLFLDGAYGMQTAWQDADHAYPDGSTGSAKLSIEQIVEIGKKVTNMGGSHLVVHCIGYQACKAMVEAARQLRESVYTRDLVIRAAHFETCDETMLGEAEKLGMFIHMQPAFSQDVTTYADILPNPQQVNPLAYAARIMKEHFSLGSDSMPLGLLPTAKLALYPPMPHQKPAESFGLLLPTLTKHSARITSEHNHLGVFKAGADADFVVLSTIPRSEADFDTVKVLETWVSGRKVWEYEAADIQAAASR